MYFDKLSNKKENFSLQGWKQLNFFECLDLIRFLELFNESCAR